MERRFYKTLRVEFSSFLSETFLQEQALVARNQGARTRIIQTRLIHLFFRTIQKSIARSQKNIITSTRPLTYYQVSRKKKACYKVSEGLRAQARAKARERDESKSRTSPVFCLYDEGFLLSSPRFAQAVQASSSPRNKRVSIGSGREQSRDCPLFEFPRRSVSRR